MTEPRCRFCGSGLQQTFIDLGMSPLSNSYLLIDQLHEMEPFFPLHAWVCGQCFLVQLEEFQSPEKIFRDYAYFSSYSKSWLKHARVLAEGAIERFSLNKESLVVEVASNDGYLLQYFKAQGVPVLGVEPAENVAKAAENKGIRTLTKFFSLKTAQEMREAGQSADLIVANNVLAHVPDLNDFIAGLELILRPKGAIAVEFPHLLRLMQGSQFDTIYHEHFSYFSFCTAENVFAAHGLRVFEVQEMATHGGSLRLFLCSKKSDLHPQRPAVSELRERELAAGMRNLDTYSHFEERVRENKRALLECLIGVKRAGKTIVGYGAAAKGNTLLNYCGIGKDFLDYTVDISPHKQDHFLPGTHIPIRHPDMIRQTKPDYVLILAWNLRDEILAQLKEIKQWGGRAIIPIPIPEVIE